MTDRRPQLDPVERVLAEMVRAVVAEDRQRRRRLRLIDPKERRTAA